MKRSVLTGSLLMAVCLMMTSCATCKKASPPNVPFRCVVEAAAEIVYEIHLDGKFVSSGKTVLSGKGMMMVDLVTIPGDHNLAVSSPGYVTWRKNITVLDGLKFGPLFVVELKKVE